MHTHPKRYSFVELQAAFPIAAAAPARCHTPSNIEQLSRNGMAPVFQKANYPDLNSNAIAGLDHEWFQLLCVEDKNALLIEVFALPNIVAISNSTRSEWLKIIFAAAHAASLGATSAYAITLKWSRLGKTFNQIDFDKAWSSFREDRI